MDHLPVGLDIAIHPGPCPGPAPAPDVASDGHPVSNGHIDDHWDHVEEQSECLQELCHFEPSSERCAFHQITNGLHVALKNDVGERDGRNGVPPVSNGVLNGFADTSPATIACDGDAEAGLQKHSEALLPANAKERLGVAGSEVQVPSCNGVSLVADEDEEGVGAGAGAEVGGGGGGRRSGGREQDGVRAWCVCATALLNYAIGT